MLMMEAFSIRREDSAWSLLLGEKTRSASNSERSPGTLPFPSSTPCRRSHTRHRVRGDARLDCIRSRNFGSIPSLVGGQIRPRTNLAADDEGIARLPSSLRRRLLLRIRCDLNHVLFLSPDLNHFLHRPRPRAREFSPTTKCNPPQRCVRSRKKCTPSRLDAARADSCDRGW